MISDGENGDKNCDDSNYIYTDNGFDYIRAAIHPCRGQELRISNLIRLIDEWRRLVIEKEFARPSKNSRFDWRLVI